MTPPHRASPPAIRPIETRYRGHRYRSRLEARWAVFFDVAGIPFEYEREGFELRDEEGAIIRYLPDFWLPGQQCWVEIKGQQPTLEEMEKAWRLEHATGHRMFIFAGAITVPDSQIRPVAGCPALRVDGDFEILEDCYLWAECPLCERLTIVAYGSILQMPCECSKSIFSDAYVDLLGLTASDDVPDPRASWIAAKLDHFERGYDSPRLIEAYRAARYARFEFGEAGAR